MTAQPDHLSPAAGGVRARLRARRLRRLILPLMIFALGGTVTTVVFRLLATAEQERRRMEFSIVAEERAAAIDRELESSINVIQAVVAFYESSTQVERHEFRSFVTPLLNRHRQILALEWVPFVRDEQRPLFEEAARAEGYEGFTFVERSPSGSREIAASHEGYFPIYYAEPEEINREILGLDLASAPIRRAALERARDSGRLVSSDVIQPLQHAARAPAIVVVAPVYQPGAGPLETVAARRRHLLGFVVGVLQLADVVSRALDRLSVRGADMLIYDVKDPDRPELLHAQPAGMREGDGLGFDPDAALTRSPFAQDLSLIFADRQWMLRFVPAPGFSPPPRNHGFLILAAGLLLSAFAGGYAAVLERQQKVIRRTVAERTAELEQSQRTLAFEKHLSEAILESMSEGVVVADVSGKFALWNPAATALVGIGRSDVGPDEWSSHYGVYLPDRSTHFPPEELALVRALAGERIDNQEQFIRNAGNAEGVWLSVSARPIRDDATGFRGAVAVFHDVSAVKQIQEYLCEVNTILEDKVLERTEDLERSNRDLEQFAFIASHDLQEPLRKVRVFGDRLVAECGASLTERGRDYLARMQNASARMERLLSDLLALSRVTTKVRPFEMVALAAVAREILSDLEVQVRSVNAEIVVEHLPTVHADPVQMRQLFQNLIANALKFHDASRTPRVRISARPDEPLESDTASPSEQAVPRWRIVVEDNGIGFDQKHAARIFEPFERLHGRGEYDGTGMGLAICQKIVKRHGGTLTAAGRPGEGATFTIVLPDEQSTKEGPACTADTTASQS